MKYALLLAACIATNTDHLLPAEKKTTQKTSSASEQKESKNEKDKEIVYVPVPVPQPAQAADQKLTESQKDEALFLHFLNILGNFTKVVVDPHNKQNVVAGIGNIVSSVYGAAHTVIARSPGKRRVVYVRALKHLCQVLEEALAEQA